jgi:hypothetical protein
MSKERGFIKMFLIPFNLVYVMFLFVESASHYISSLPGFSSPYISLSSSPSLSPFSSSLLFSFSTIPINKTENPPQILLLQETPTPKPLLPLPLRPEKEVLLPL